MSLRSEPWWNIESLPTPSEWQALFAFATLVVATIGIIYGLRQLGLTREQVKQGREQLEESARAVVRSAEAEEAKTRPYVNVRFLLHANPPLSPSNEQTEGIVYVIVESVGQTPVRDLRLTVSPPFQSSGRGRPPGDDPVMKTLRKVFSGDFVISMLSGTERLRYFLDFSGDAMDPNKDLPQRYEVRARYWDAEKTREYSGLFILDLEAWQMTIMEPLSTDVIAKQMRRLNSNIENKLN